MKRGLRDLQSRRLDGNVKQRCGGDGFLVAQIEPDGQRCRSRRAVAAQLITASLRTVPLESLIVMYPATVSPPSALYVPNCT